MVVSPPKKRALEMVPKGNPAKCPSSLVAQGPLLGFGALDKKRSEKLGKVLMAAKSTSLLPSLELMTVNIQVYMAALVNFPMPCCRASIRERRAGSRVGRLSSFGGFARRDANLGHVSPYSLLKIPAFFRVLLRPLGFPW